MVEVGKPSRNVIENYQPPPRKNQQEQGGKTLPLEAYDNDVRPPHRAEVLWLRWRRLASKVMHKLSEEPSSENFEMLRDSRS